MQKYYCYCVLLIILTVAFLCIVVTKNELKEESNIDLSIEKKEFFGSSKSLSLRKTENKYLTFFFLKKKLKFQD